jgi:hypothetical protein
MNGAEATGDAGTSTSNGPPTSSGSTTNADASTSLSTADPSGPTEGSTSSVGPECGGSWWDSQWTRRRLLQVGSDGLQESLANGVVLVRLDPARIDYAATEAEGADLRFVRDGVELDYEIERWTPGGDSEIWVLLGTVDVDTENDLHMYYGNTGAEAASNGAATWANGFVSVHHLASLADSTGNGHEGSTANAPGETGGQIAGARVFDGDDDYVELPPESDFDFDVSLTVEAWIRVAGFDVEWQAVVNKGDDAWRMQRAGSTNAMNFGSDPPNTNLDGLLSVNDGQWHYVAITYGDQTQRIFVDGQLDVEAPFTGPIANTTHAVRLGDNLQVPGRNFAGDMDEVRISSIERPAGWFAWQLASMAEGVVQFGAEETCE